MYEGDHIMAQLEKLQRTNKLSRLFVVFLAAMILTSTATLFAQQSPRIHPQSTSTTTNVNQKETNNMTQVSTAAATTKAADAIRPFHVNFPEAALVNLRRRIAATKWPEREPVSDATQGVQ